MKRITDIYNWWWNVCWCCFHRNERTNVACSYARLNLPKNQNFIIIFAAFLVFCQRFVFGFFYHHRLIINHFTKFGDVFCGLCLCVLCFVTSADCICMCCSVDGFFGYFENTFSLSKKKLWKKIFIDAIPSFVMTWDLCVLNLFCCFTLLGL